jgi:hypothetical protein
MRAPPWEKVAPYRLQLPGRPSDRRDDFGDFLIPCGAVKLAVIASAGDEWVKWEHVSVSIPGHQRTPTWAEMDYIKRLFWGDDECVMQLHVPAAEHKNHHPWCLHLWRPKETAIPRPPNWTVA